MIDSGGGLENKESPSFSDDVRPPGVDERCRCPSYLCWMLSSGTWRDSRGCSDGDSSSSAGDMNHSSAWQLLKNPQSFFSSTCQLTLHDRPSSTATHSASDGFSITRLLWPEKSMATREFSEMLLWNKHRKDVTLFTVCVGRRFDALHGGGQRRPPLVLHCHLVSVKIAPSLLFLSESRQKSQLNGIKWALKPK